MDPRSRDTDPAPIPPVAEGPDPVGRRAGSERRKALSLAARAVAAVLFVTSLTGGAWIATTRLRAPSPGEPVVVTIPEPDARAPSTAEATGSQRAFGAPPSAGSLYVPVLLVPGWFDTERELAALRIRLLGSGWPDDRVGAITFADPTGSNRTHATELDTAVDSLLAESGAERIDIVAHSMGGLATRWYLLKHPDAPVRRVAFIATPHRGTVSALLAWGGGREEMMPDSPFLDSLNRAAPVPDGVETVTIRTTVDTHVVPGESATLPGVPDHLLCCPTHAGLLQDEEAFEIVRAFLQDGPGG